MRGARGRFATLLTVFILAASSASWADEPFGVKLLRPDSLAGWDHGDPPPAGWTIAEGKLSGNRQSSLLLSGYSFGDFELRLQWSVGGGGALRLLFPEVPNGPGLELLLREGDGCGRLLDGLSKTAIVVDLVADPPHTQLIAEAQERGLRTVDGLELYVEQAAISFRLWTTLELDRAVISEAVEEYLEL